MNLRFWGGWFLAVACVCIFLTMGCSDGHLGVKSATVTGRVLDKTNRNPIPNATVRLMSQESVGSGDLQQGYNFLSTTTNAQGEFFFEDVNPDNVVLMFEAKGYASKIFPSTEDQTTEEETAESETSDIEYVSIRSGKHVNIADVLLNPNGKKVADSVEVKLDFIDSITGRQIKDGNFSVVISSVGESFRENDADYWRYRGEKIPGSNDSVTIFVSDSEGNYKSTTMVVDASCDVHQVVELEPVTCKISVVFDINSIPQYMLDSRDGAAAQILVVEKDGSDNSSIKICEENVVLNQITRICNMDVPRAKLPCKMIVRVLGYKEVEYDIDSNNFRNGQLEKAGNYVINARFSKGELVIGDNPDTVAKPRMLGNIEVTMIGLEDNDTVQMEINLPYTQDPLWTPQYGDEGDAGLVTDGKVKVFYTGVPTGYDLTYTISVRTVASGSYLISSGKSPIFIPVAENESEVKRIFLDVSKMSSSATSEE